MFNNGTVGFFGGPALRLRAGFRDAGKNLVEIKTRLFGDVAFCNAGGFLARLACIVRGHRGLERGIVLHQPERHRRSHAEADDETDENAEQRAAVVASRAFGD